MSSPEPRWPSDDERRAALAPLYRYCDLVDAGRVPIGIFTPDCTVDYGTSRGVIRGRDDVAAFFGRNHAVLRHTSHHLSNVRVRPKADQPGVYVIGSHVLAWHELTDGRRFDVFGRYDDVVVRRGDRFLIRNRRFRTYGSSDPAFRFARVDRVQSATS